MKKIKILSVCDRGYVLGGTEINMLAKVNGLRNLGHDAKIFTSNFNPTSGPLFSDFVFNGFNENSSVRWIYQIFNPFSYFKFRKVLKEYQPDIIHMHNIFYQVSPSILLAVGNTPVVLTLHSYELICPTGAIIREDGSRCISPGKHDLRCTGSVKGYIYEIIKQFVHSLLLRKVTIYTVPSKSMRKDFINQNIIRCPIRTIYNGVELSKYVPIINLNRILYIGRLSREKGVETLINAFRIIKDKYPDIYLDIIGDGPEMSNLQNICKVLNLKESVRFHGQIKKNNVNDFIIKSTVVVVPSICPEAFSLVGAEALAIGRPIIGSNLGAIPEWLIDGKCGFLFPPGNVESLSSKVIEILGNKSLLYDMSTFSYGHSKNFSVDSNTNNFESLYYELINKG